MFHLMIILGLSFGLTIGGAANAQESLMFDPSGAIPSESITERPIAPATDGGSGAPAIKKASTSGKAKAVQSNLKGKKADKQRTTGAAVQKRKTERQALANKKSVPTPKHFVSKPKRAVPKMKKAITPILKPGQDSVPSN